MTMPQIVVETREQTFADNPNAAAVLAERLLCKFWKRAVADREGQVAA